MDKKRVLKKFIEVENKAETVSAMAAYACLNNDPDLFDFLLKHGLIENNQFLYKINSLKM